MGVKSLTFYSYFRDSVDRSFTRWERSDAVSTLFSYALSLGGVGALDALGIGTVLEPLNGFVKTGLYLVFWFTLLVFVVTPFRMWREERQALNHIAERLQKSLLISFKQEKPYLDVTRRGGPGTRYTYHFSIGVTNLSALETIKNVHVRVKNIKNYDHFFKEWSLRPHSGPSPFNLDPSQTQYIHLASWTGPAREGKRFRMDKEELRPGVSHYSFVDAQCDRNGLEEIRAIQLEYADEAPNALPFGAYTIEVVAYGENVPASLSTFRFVRKLGWKLELVEVQNHVAWEIPQLGRGAGNEEVGSFRERASVGGRQRALRAPVSRNGESQA